LFTAWRCLPKGCPMSLRSLSAQFAALVGAYLRLFKTEQTLLRSELQGAASGLTRGVVLLVIAALFFLVAIVLFAEAGVTALTDNGWSAHWANLIVGLSVCAIGCILFLVGRSSLRRFSIVPHHTFTQIRKDFEFAREGMGWHRR
jgi:hypothetical protein